MPAFVIPTLLSRSLSHVFPLNRVASQLDADLFTHAHGWQRVGFSACDLQMSTFAFLAKSCRSCGCCCVKVQLCALCALCVLCALCALVHRTGGWSVCFYVHAHVMWIRKCVWLCCVAVVCVSLFLCVCLCVCKALEISHTNWTLLLHSAESTITAQNHRVAFYSKLCVCVQMA